MLFKMLEAHLLIVVMLCSCGCWMGQEWIRMDFGPKCSGQWTKVLVQYCWNEVAELLN
jgi:hypothetical protein